MKKIIVFFLAIQVCFPAFSQELQTDNKAVITNEATINGKNLEFSPTFYENGIVFISTDETSKNKITDEKQKNLKGVSVQIARRNTEGTLSAPSIFSPRLTTNYNDGPLSFDRENKTMFYSTNNVKKGKAIRSKDGRINQRIFISNQEKGDFPVGIDLPFNDNEFDNCHPSVSVDGNTLYFASNRPGGIGGMDIYLVKKVGDTWGNPINLGPDVNTAKNDVFPYIHADGTLYFASNGRGGAGGLDIFYTRKKDDAPYDAPVNLGLPYNSAADDFGFIVDAEGKNGYFSSNREGGKGEDDIYSFTTQNIIGKKIDKSDECRLIVNTVESLNSKDIQGAKIKVINISDYEIGEVLTDNTGKLIKLSSNDSTNILTSVTDNGATEFFTDSEGKAELKLKKGKYLLNISKNGYQNQQKLVANCDGNDEELVKMETIGDNSIPLAGVLKSNRGTPIANATVTLTDAKTGETQVIKTDNEGKYKYFVKPDNEYNVAVTKDNYLASSTKISTKNLKNGSPEIPINIEMAELNSPIQEGKIFQLKNVYYNYNDASLRPDARLDLDPLVSILKTYPEVEIELSSHTDSRGKSDYNQNLSQKRAESAVKYLTDRGIAAKRIKAVGYGETQLRNKCADGTTCGEVEHKINRRTEVKITKAPNDLNISVVDQYSNSKSEGNTPSKTTTKTTSDVAASTNTATKTTSSTPNKPETTPISINPGSNPIALPGEFWVVAGSYQSISNAEDQARKLTKKGYVPVVIFASEINFYRVLVEKTLDLAQARKVLKELRNLHEPAFALRF